MDETLTALDQGAGEKKEKMLPKAHEGPPHKDPANKGSAHKGPGGPTRALPIRAQGLSREFVLLFSHYSNLPCFLRTKTQPITVFHTHVQIVVFIHICTYIYTYVAVLH